MYISPESFYAYPGGFYVSTGYFYISPGGSSPTVSYAFVKVKVENESKIGKTHKLLLH